MEYRVLGPLEALGSEGLLPLGGAKQRALLALLILNANGVVSRARLIDELWGDEPPDTAVASVQVYVSRLRKLMPEASLLTRPPGYVLAAEPNSVDFLRFESLFKDGRTALAARDPERAARVLRDALDVWRGPALAEFADEPFAQIEGGRLDDQRIAALEPDRCRPGARPPRGADRRTGGANRVEPASREAEGTADAGALPVGETS